MLDRDAVIWGYRYLLQREPESETVINTQRGFANYMALRDAFMASPEYRARNNHDQWRDKWVVAEVHGGARLIWLNLADRYVSFPALEDQYEPLETAVLTKLLQPGQTFLDIGANIGWFTLLASTLIGDAGHVHAFEPRPETAHHLAKTIAINGLEQQVTLHRFGLADRSTEMNLTWSPTKDNPGGSRLVHGDLPDGSGGACVPLRRLDDLALDACDIIKIDVEGAECIAMAGAEETVRRFRPVILSELHASQLRDVSRCSAQDYVNAMIGRGYRCFSIEPASHGAELMQMEADMAERLLNVVFAPSERADCIRASLFD